MGPGLEHAAAVTPEALARRSEPAPAIRLIETLVASAFRVDPAALRSPTRGNATVAFARQVAMYLAYTRLGLSYEVAGLVFGRDRTTVAHACRLVEERRDDPRLDSALDYLERAAALFRGSLADVDRPRRA
ncbi:MAG TPA: helix-turn-helix domain-containing protein [Bauldia sp.]|nr:helix-turn-helix domain-containing protein [Bauldia sp.]